MGVTEGFAQAFAEELKRLHDQLRANVSGLEAAALNWVPAAQTNSIAMLVSHILGSETEVLHTVRGIPTNRDRDAEFRQRVEGAGELLEQIALADALLDEFSAGITTEALMTERVRPSAVRIKTPKMGIFWLLNSYGHTREHIGHVELTLQMYRSNAR